MIPTRRGQRLLNHLAQPDIRELLTRYANPHAGHTGVPPSSNAPANPNGYAAANTGRRQSTCTPTRDGQPYPSNKDHQESANSLRQPRRHPDEKRQPPAGQRADRRQLG
jgi:hypothetical protein